MKRVRASTATYDSTVGRIEVGQTYEVEDDVAKRWISAGVATAAKDDDDEQDDEGDEKDPEQLAADAHALHDKGLSERQIAQELGVSRSRVHSLLS